MPSSKAASSTTAAPLLPVYVCVHLPQHNRVYELLQRVVNEFIPIIQQRKYNITSISEMCCCCDGLDAANDDQQPVKLTMTAASARTKQKNGGKKRPIMPSSVLGYNQTIRWSRNSSSPRSRHTIHIRMRRPNKHTNFYEYEDIAGTLAHELAHCEVFPHNKEFFKVMDSILDDHSKLLSPSMSGRVHGFGMQSASSTIQPFTGSGQTLGGNNSNNNIPVTASSIPGDGQRLGSGSSKNNSSNKSRVIQEHDANNGRKLGSYNGTTVQSARHNAAAAAEARRNQIQTILKNRRQTNGNDTTCCQPCIIDLTTAFTDDDKADDTHDSLKRSGKQQKQQNDDDYDVVLIDLTDQTTTKKQRQRHVTSSVAKAASFSTVIVCHVCTYENEEENNENSCGKCQICHSSLPKNTSKNDDNVSSSWICTVCTFLNKSGRSSINSNCTMCNSLRSIEIVKKL